MTDRLPTETATDTSPEDLDADVATSAGPVRIARNVLLAATVGGLAALVAVAFAVRAVDGGSTLDWLCLAVVSLVALGHLITLLDARAPLMVVDEHGVRVRDGARWEGVSWPEVECLEHLPRRGLRDGHLLVVGYDDHQLLVPLTMATTISGAAPGSLSDVLAGLAAGRADVVEVVPGLPEDAATLDVDHLDEVDEADEVATADSTELAGELSTERPARDDDGPSSTDTVVRDKPFFPPPAPGAELDEARTDEIPAVPADGSVPDGGSAPDDRGGHPRMATSEPTSEPTPEPTPEPTRATVLPARVEYPSSYQPRGRSDVDSQSAAEPGTAPSGAADTMTVVLEDLRVHPAPDPVVGPQLAAARQRLRLTVDQLSERTRIRPHVIEAIEVDDFAPCGGDFYARGHLRTIGRVLGIDTADLVAAYDATYADAPVDPRRVFESELATGVGGSIRSTRGGRNWSVLIAAVMAAVLVWSVAQLLMGGPTPVGNTPVLSQTGSGGIGNKTQQASSVHLTLTAAGGGAKVVVRDGGGDIVFDGQLAFGQSSEMDLVPPVRISSSDGSVTASLDGEPAAALGATGEEATKTLVAP